MKNQDVIQELTSKVDYLINRFDEFVFKNSSQPYQSEIDNLLEDKVDATQAAAILKRSLSCIYSKCSSGEIEYSKDIGGRLIFSKKYLLAYLENRNGRNTIQKEKSTNQHSSKMRANREKYSPKK